MPNTQQIYPSGRDTWHARPTVVNAGVDGSGTLAQFKGTPGMKWPGGAQVTNAVVASEAGSPTEVYNLFLITPGSGAVRRVYTFSVTAGVTEFQPVDLWIPPGSEVSASTVGGVDANIWLTVDLFS